MVCNVERVDFRCDVCLEFRGEILIIQVTSYPQIFHKFGDPCVRTASHGVKHALNCKCIPN